MKWYQKPGLSAQQSAPAVHRDNAAEVCDYLYLRNSMKQSLQRMARSLI